MGGNSSFEKMLAMCASTVFRANRQLVADRLTRSSFGHQSEDAALPVREVVKRDTRTSPVEHRDDCWIDDRSALGDPTDRVGEIVEIG